RQRFPSLRGVRVGREGTSGGSEVPMGANQDRSVELMRQIAAVEEISRFDGKTRHVLEQVQLALASQTADRQQVFTRHQGNLVQSRNDAARRGRSVPQTELRTSLQEEQRTTHAV